MGERHMSGPDEFDRHLRLELKAGRIDHDVRINWKGLMQKRSTERERV
jgi:hypothetical protein